MKLALFAFVLMSLFFTVTLAGSNGRSPAKCKDNTLKCGGGNPGGTVFICRYGRWEVLMDCAAGESCVTIPNPTCTWAKALADDAAGAVTGFENSEDMVVADVKKKADPTAPITSVDNKVWLLTFSAEF